MKTTDLTWQEIQTLLPTATEKQCAEMLENERKGKKRTQHILRIHGRFNVLRAQRERKELLK